MHKCEDAMVTAFSLTVLYLILSNRYMYKCTHRIVTGCKLDVIADVCSESGEPLLLGRSLHSIIFFALALAIITDNIALMMFMLFILFSLTFMYGLP